MLAAGEISADQVNAATAATVRWMATKPKAQLVQMAVEEAFLLAAAQSIGDLFLDPQLQARDFWQHSAGRRRTGPFAKLSATPLSVDRPAPKLGNKLDVLAFIERWRREPSAAPQNTHARAAFAGLKVADFAWVGVGPMIAKALADHGATVVHVESSQRPDVLRLLPPFKDGVPGLDRAQFMANFNTSKLGLALDMSTADGRTMARGVADWADVVIESFTPGNMTKFGLDYATLSAKRPDLVMVSTCMRGQTGPQNRYGGFGGQGAAMAGFVEITGWPDRPPVGPWGAYTDFITPRYGVAALAAALHHRRETGQGQYIDLSQIEAGIQFLEPLLNDFDVNGRQAQRAGHNSMYASPNGVYECAGIERYVALAVETAAQWRALARLLGDTAPVGFTDGAHLDSMPARRAVAHTIDAAISRWCASRDAFAAANALQQAGVPAHAVMRPSDLYFDAQLNHRNFFAKLAHPVMGNTPYDGFVTQFSGRMHGPYTAAPTLGQHSHQVLCDMLGVSEQMYADLLAAGVLR